VTAGNGGTRIGPQSSSGGNGGIGAGIVNYPPATVSGNIVFLL